MPICQVYFFSVVFSSFLYPYCLPTCVVGYTMQVWVSMLDDVRTMTKSLNDEFLIMYPCR